MAGLDPLLGLDTAPAGRRRRRTVVDTMVVVEKGETLSGIANRLLARSARYTNLQLVEDIRRVNALATDTVKVGQQLRIPLNAVEPDVKPSRPAPSSQFIARGIYVNAPLAGSQHVRALADQLVLAGGNAIVFDIKDRPGDLSYASENPVAKRIGASSRASIARPQRLVEMLHQRQIYVIARITCFLDARLASTCPELAPRSRAEDGPWLQKGQLNWVDPAKPEVQNYLLSIVDEVAQMGVDEIQLDYIRFPTEGEIEDALFDFDSETVTKDQIITGFLSRVRERLGSRPILLSADIFGVVAWGRAADREATGQNLREMLLHLDVVSPMLYPSHFYDGFDGVRKPAQYPYYFLLHGCRLLSRLAADYGTAVRPWLQAFSYRVPEFDRKYITEQMSGAKDGGARGWLLWNAAANYEHGLAAIQEYLEEPAPVDSLQRQDRLPPSEKTDAQQRDPLGAEMGSDWSSRRAGK